VKALLVLVACVLGGLAAGAIWTWLQADRYRADARVLVRPASSRIVPAVEALAESSLVASNVAQTLRLSSPPSISAMRGDGGVLTISVEAGGRERARQIDAETVVLLTQKVAQRFAAAGVTATLLDPAHVAEQTSPTPRRNLLVTGLIGFALGLVGVFALVPRRVRTAPPESVVDPQAATRLQARLDAVTKREQSLARRAGELAARERSLAAREEALEAAVREAERKPPPEPEPEPAPEPPPPEPEPEPTPSVLPSPAVSRWNLNELERLVRARADVPPETADEWRTYLQLLREHAAVDGTLPAGFDGLLNDVFADLAPSLELNASTEA
jgi:capsular polysaccharide biosynthesis protein